MKELLLYKAGVPHVRLHSARCSSIHAMDPPDDSSRLLFLNLVIRFAKKIGQAMRSRALEIVS